jgi:hypothetical protein
MMNVQKRDIVRGLKEVYGNEDFCCDICGDDLERPIEVSMICEKCEKDIYETAMEEYDESDEKKTIY